MEADRDEKMSGSPDSNQSRKRKREANVNDGPNQKDPEQASLQDAEDYDEDLEDDVYRDEEYGVYNDNEEPEGEGDEQPSEEIEPSEERFGSLPFYQICKQLEKITTKRSKPITTKQKLMNLLPPVGLKALMKVEPGSPPSTPFPLIRLLCPEKDASRDYQIKHAMLARAYMKAFGWKKETSVLAQALLKPNDPDKITAAKLPPVNGDISELIKCILKGRVSEEPSKLTVADINRRLDELASIKHRGNTPPTNHDWQAGAVLSRRRDDFEKKNNLHGRWIENLLNGDNRLSPLEHKWLARIILKEMKISLGFDKILLWFDPLAPSLWSGHNSLRGLCKIICQPDFSNKAVLASESFGGDGAFQTMAPYLTKSTAQIKLGVPFTPMFSHRTGFDRMLYDLSLKHRTYLKDPIFGKLEEKTSLKMTSCMVLEHPAFAIETKLDGERMLVHLSRDGLVKIHTRQSNWYSDVYSPVLGPAIRKAFGHLKMDMIIDGEILAWDNGKNETVPFGNNRTVAQFRADWMKYKGLLDTRDRNLHSGEKDVKVVHLNMLWKNDDGHVPDLNGRDCWLQFIAFDIVFLEGEGAQELLNEIVSPFIKAKPGSLMDLECMERKKILYRVIHTVHKFVEVVPTLVISSDGETYLGSEYFSLDDPPKFMGRPLHSLDSAAAFLHELSDPRKARSRKALEEQRRQGLSNQDISQKRAHAVSQHYNRIVDDQRQEGLIFKDLSTPYVLDKVSRSLGYWRKFKPDYYNGSVASDIDLVVIGAYFASGLRNSGRPSGYLMACTNEQEEEDKYVPLCKVNAGSMPYVEARKILEKTGYKTPYGDNPLDLGKWFSYGDDTKECPDFVSSLSFATEVPSTDGWQPAKKDYPDLWINPEDSVVLTLNAGEIVPSSAFPSRVTLRFPRITALREDKKAREVEALQVLWEIYDKVLADRAGDNTERGFESQVNQLDNSMSKNERFWTEEKYSTDGKRRKTNRPKLVRSVAAAGHDTSVESSALTDVTFVPLEGTYRLVDNSLEAAEGLEEGWLDQAKGIRHVGDIRALIKKHGGKVVLAPDSKLIEDGAIVIGGDKDDPRVTNLIGMVENSMRQVPEIRLKKKRSIAENIAMSFAKCDGVVRWTFLLSVLKKWQYFQDVGAGDKKICEAQPSLLTPNPLDFLVRPKNPNEDIVEELSRIDVDDVIKMRRLLTEVAEDANDDETGSQANNVSWQEICKTSLDSSSRWIVRCRKQVLWPYEEDKVVFQETAVYIDVFDDPSDGSNRLSVVDPFAQATLLSVLPLLRLAGASVETRLGARVTHVLCELCDDYRKFPFEKAKPVYFLDPVRGRQLIDHVKNSCLYPDRTPYLVSPEWVRKDVWEQEGTP